MNIRCVSLKRIIARIRPGCKALPQNEPHVLRVGGDNGTGDSHQPRLLGEATVHEGVARVDERVGA